MHDFIILVRSAFINENKYYPQVFLENAIIKMLYFQTFDIIKINIKKRKFYFSKKRTMDINHGNIEPISRSDNHSTGKNSYKFMLVI